MTFLSSRGLSVVFQLSLTTINMNINELVKRIELRELRLEKALEFLKSKGTDRPEVEAFKLMQQHVDDLYELVKIESGLAEMFKNMYQLEHEKTMIEKWNSPYSKPKAPYNSYNYKY